MATRSLASLFGAPQSAAAEEQRQWERDRAEATMTPMDYFALAAKRGAREAVGGLGAALGVNTQSQAQRHEAAIERAKTRARALGFDPDDPASIDRFYREVIRILQSEGLVAEALEVAREYQQQKVAERRASAAEDMVAQRREAAELRAQTARESLEAAKQKLGGRDPEFVVLLDRLAALETRLASLDAGDPQRQSVELAITNLLSRLNRLGQQRSVRVLKTNDRYEVYDAATGEVVRSGGLGERPEPPGAAQKREAAEAKAAVADAKAQTAYAAMKESIQAQYDAAVSLHNEPGLREITGRPYGVIFDNTPSGPGRAFAEATLSDAGRRALGLFNQVRGGAFLSGLAELKRASPTGATGLGQVTEIEGQKVENAKLALALSQPTPAFRGHLKRYVESIERAAQIIDAEAQTLGFNVVPLRQRQLITPSKYDRNPRPDAIARPPAERSPQRTLTYDPKTGEIR